LTPATRRRSRGRTTPSASRPGDTAGAQLDAPERGAIDHRALRTFAHRNFARRTATMIASCVERSTGGALDDVARDSVDDVSLAVRRFPIDLFDMHRASRIDRRLRIPAHTGGASEYACCKVIDK